MNKILSYMLGCLLLGQIGATQTLAAPLLLPDPAKTALQYGDFYSYSLPILAHEYALYNTSQPNPYSINSTPGAIKLLPVIATGAEGQDVTTNESGMDNAYSTPGGTGGATSFSTFGGANLGTGKGILGAQADTWDINLSALTSFLSGGGLVVLFNNKQDDKKKNVAQDLLAWGQISIRDAEGKLPALYFDFTSTSKNGEGVVGGDVTKYDSPGIWSPAPVARNAKGEVVDYVISHGSVVYTDSKGTTESIDHNLGTNEAAYALMSPEINAFLRGWDSKTSGYDVMSFYVSLKELNGGYEQIFLTASAPPSVPTPEPGTLLLVGAGALGAACLRRARKP